MTKPSFSKFIRPEHPRTGVITERDLDIIETILRYRFSPTSELSRLVGGHEDVNLKRLRKLWEWGYVSRFAFPGIDQAEAAIRFFHKTVHGLDNYQPLSKETGQAL